MRGIGKAGGVVEFVWPCGSASWGVALGDAGIVREG